MGEPWYPRKTMETETDLDVGNAALLSDSADDTRTNVYEIGYHLLPTLSEDAVTEAVKGLMDTIKKEGAEFVGDRFPSKIPLAYPIAKRVAGKLLNFDSAYFGWVAFEVARTSAARLKEVLDAHPSVLRSLIVVTDRDAVAAAMSAAEIPMGPTGSIEKPKREAEVGGEMSEVALDEALQTIATEDTKVAE